MKLLNLGIIVIGGMPLIVRRWLAALLALLMLLLGRDRMKTVAHNLEYCLPCLFPPETSYNTTNQNNQTTNPKTLSRFRMAYYHALAFFDFIAALHSDNTLVSDLIEVRGEEYLKPSRIVPEDDTKKQNHPIGTLLYIPHFVGLGLATRYLTAYHHTAFLYSPSKYTPIARWMKKKFQQLSHNRAFEKNHSIIPLARLLRRGSLVQLSTDLDVGEHGTKLVPFLGHSVATSMAVPHFAKSFNAKVVGVCCTIIPTNSQGKRYLLECEPIDIDWKQLDEITAQTHLHQWLESKLRKYPEQYLWFHKRFKTADRLKKANTLL